MRLLLEIIELVFLFSALSYGLRNKYEVAYVLMTFAYLTGEVL